ITGATGFLGGHLAEACAARGLRVKALARPSSDASALLKPNIEVVRGDLSEPDTLPAALDGVEVVFHAAARVGDWRPVGGSGAGTAGGTRALRAPCKGRRLRRFVHSSSPGVYAARHHYGTTEEEPLPDRHIDGYTQSKVEAERLALEYQREHGVPVTVL